MSPGSSTATETTNVSPRIYDLAIDRYGFNYPLWTDNSGDDADVHGQEHFDDDEEDEENKEITPPAGDYDLDDNQPQRVRRSNGVPFQRVEITTGSVIRSLFE